METQTVETQITTLDVWVKPHHMKGNSWTHGEADASRKCPLYEALEEAKHEEIYVGGLVALVDGTTYRYPNNWNRAAAMEYIRKANEEGCEDEILVSLIPLVHAPF